MLDIYRAQDSSYRSYIGIYDRVRLAATGSAVAFYPDSNMFLGSGLFDLDAAWSYGVSVGLGSDIAGGTSYSPLYALNQAYKVVAVRGGSLHALRGFYLATLGAREPCPWIATSATSLPARKPTSPFSTSRPPPPWPAAPGSPRISPSACSP